MKTFEKSFEPQIDPIKLAAATAEREENERSRRATKREERRAAVKRALPTAGFAAFALALAVTGAKHVEKPDCRGTQSFNVQPGDTLNEFKKHVKFIGEDLSFDEIPAGTYRTVITPASSETQSFANAGTTQELQEHAANLMPGDEVRVPEVCES